MKQKRILVTGSSGLIGSEVVSYFSSLGFLVNGVDNNQREAFFGLAASTRWNQFRLEKAFSSFQHHELDIRDRDAVLKLVETLRPIAIVHAAAQPSHDLAAKIPFEDFDTNATGTLNLLEATRRYCRDSPFVYLSTNKVYGDAPNRLALRELESRWDFSEKEYENGISEICPVDQSMHSLFGVSKLAADVMVQEYGRYFDMPTVCLRGGCLTGPWHSGVELHGFLSYLVKCNLTRSMYRIYGYKGKQVRDNIHSEDVARFIGHFLEAPRGGSVYNLGGGKRNSISILEAFSLIESISGKPMLWEYSPQARAGDHIVYYSDLQKARRDYPAWNITWGLKEIFESIYLGVEKKLFSIPN